MGSQEFTDKAQAAETDLVDFKYVVNVPKQSRYSDLSPPTKEDLAEEYICREKLRAEVDYTAQALSRKQFAWGSATMTPSGKAYAFKDPKHAEGMKDYIKS